MVSAIRKFVKSLKRAKILKRQRRSLTGSLKAREATKMLHTPAKIEAVPTPVVPTPRSEIGSLKAPNEPTEEECEEFWREEYLKKECEEYEEFQREERNRILVREFLLGDSRKVAPIKPEPTEEECEEFWREEYLQQEFRALPENVQYYYRGEHT
jgi:hypothetical protein